MYWTKSRRQWWVLMADQAGLDEKLILLDGTPNSRYAGREVYAKWIGEVVQK